MRVFIKSRLLEYVEASELTLEKSVAILTLLDSDKTLRIRLRDINFISQVNKRYRVSYYRYAKAQSSIDVISKKDITLSGRPFVKIVLKNQNGSKGETMYYPAAAIEE